MAKIIKKSLIGKRKSNKPLQYAIGGVVSLVILVLWITSPGRSSAFSAAAVAAGNPFSSRVTDLSALSTGDEHIKTEAERMADEMGSHEGENGILSTLFQSGVEEESAPTDSGTALAATDAPTEVPSAADVDIPSASASSSVSPSIKAKLSSSGGSSGVSGGGGGSSSSSSSHNKMFGSGSVQASTKKIDVNTGSVNTNSLTSKTPSKAIASLKKAADLSDTAAKSTNLAKASSFSSQAFDGGVKKENVEMLAGEGKAVEAANLDFGKAVTDLKSYDPSKNSKNKVVPPPSKAKDAKDEDDEMKKFLLQMLFQNVIGPVMQGVFK